MSRPDHCPLLKQKFSSNSYCMCKRSVRNLGVQTRQILSMFKSFSLRFLEKNGLLVFYEDQNGESDHIPH